MLYSTRTAAVPSLMGVIVFFTCGPALTADEDDVASGARIVISDGNRTVTDVVSRLAWEWPDNVADSRIGNVRHAELYSSLLIQQSGVHTFHVMLTGALRLTIDGAVVLDVRGDNRFFTSLPREYTAGDHDLTIHFEPLPNSQPRLQVFWSSAEFTLEPVPSGLLTHEPAGSDADRISEGRDLADALRCAACHRGLDDVPVLAAPALQPDSVSHDAVVRRLTSTAGMDERQMMPDFGLKNEDAEAVAAFLNFTWNDSTEGPHEELRQTQKPDELPTMKAGDIDAGRRLLTVTGCIACHQIPAITGNPSGSASRTDHSSEASAENSSEFGMERPLPTLSSWHGPDLTDIGRRRSGAWLFTWLANPERLNRDHRMPVFTLSSEERRQIVAALLSQPSEGDRTAATEADSEATSSRDNTGSTGGNSLRSAERPSQAIIERGRELVTQTRCAACHRIPGVETPMKLPGPGDTRFRHAVTNTGENSTVEGVRNCLSPAHPDQPATTTEPTDSGRVPHYPISAQHRSGIHAWINTITNELKPLSGALLGERLLTRRGCLSCHDRNLSRGLSRTAGITESLRDDLRGQSQALIPPALTAVGDKLRDDVLADAISGKGSDRRLPWLLVRMPRFRHTPEESTAILRHFHVTDRIPDEADAERSSLFEFYNPHHPTVATAEDLLTGNQLAGAGGFNCIACHKAGAFEPRNVAMGTRGSDILTMGRRIRPRHFFRWMHNPIRVVPGIEMPAIRRAVPGIADESLSKQMAILWTAFTDARFSPPTVVSRYEQFLTVAPGHPPRVLRDVFTLGEGSARQSVARALAVGFDNANNILVDLNTMQMRQWTLGEFARQRTEGKSWYWDMAGVTVSQDAADLFLCSLRSTRDSDITIPAVTDEKRHGELLSWQTDRSGITLRIQYHFDVPEHILTSKRVTEEQSNSRTPPSGVASVTTGKSRHTTQTAWNDESRSMLRAIVSFRMEALPGSKRDGAERPGSDQVQRSGWSVRAEAEQCPDGFALVLNGWSSRRGSGDIVWSKTIVDRDEDALTDADVVGGVTVLRAGGSAGLIFQADISPISTAPPLVPRISSSADAITSVPGFSGTRLPIPTDIMPTAMTWLEDGRLAFASLRGQVWTARDSNGDGLPDTLNLFAEGLAAPYGIQTDGDTLLVAHKPEILRLTDSDGNGTADVHRVFASGWGYSDDYHDWTTSLARDANGNYFVGLGSDYSQNHRPQDNDRWRGTILRISPSGVATPEAYSFRFPMGLAFDAAGNLFATDNQGVQNTFNEINHILPGRHYGVPSRHETFRDAQAELPAVMVPHPWTRSVNSIVFLPNNFSVPELAGHGLGCEYDTRCLIRFTIRKVDGGSQGEVLQGATYRFSLPDQPGGGSNFIGPVASAVGPDGAIYIGSIWDSGWQGGSNTGAIERISPSGMMPQGIREITAQPDGFRVAFFHPADESWITDTSTWNLQAYTRKWEGNYATPDSERHHLTPSALIREPDGKAVLVKCGPLKPGFVYEIGVRKSDDGRPETDFWPSEGFYTMKVVPVR